MIPKLLKSVEFKRSKIHIPIEIPIDFPISYDRTLNGQLVWQSDFQNDRGWNSKIEDANKKVVLQMYLKIEKINYDWQSFDVNIRLKKFWNVILSRFALNRTKTENWCFWPWRDKKPRLMRIRILNLNIFWLSFFCYNFARNNCTTIVF